MVGEKKRKPLFWVGSCKEDLREFPEDVKDEMGYALHLAQMGDETPPSEASCGLRGGGGAGGRG
jgi:phage-related protein